MAQNAAVISQCEPSALQARIQVLFEDRQLMRDDQRGLDELRLMSQSGANRNHSVLGLTRAEPSATLELTPQVVASGSGGVCAVPSLTLKLGFSVLEVYLARELNGPCRRGIVDEHEQEHVAVWRNHLRAGARLMETVLRNRLGEASYFSNPAAASAVLRQRADEVIAPLLVRLRDGIMAAHREIDSPGSYQFTERRMRACP